MMIQTDEGLDDPIVDNSFTLGLVSNPESVEDFRPSSKTLVMSAINAGFTHSNQEAAVRGFGNVYFDQVAKSKYCWTFRSEEEEVSKCIQF